jgi:acyl carrier protein phosphodiesterase
MNFLAHLHLSYPDPHLMLGNFLADFLSNKQSAALIQPIQAGISLHRKIDTYSDQHAEISKSKRLLYPTQGKYALVLVDLFYDYFLAKNWSKYHDESLEAFCAVVYAIFEKHLPDVHPLASGYVERLIEHQWLEKYISYDGIEHSISRLISRTTFESNMEQGIDDLKLWEHSMNEHFNMFYPDIISYVGLQLDEISPRN